MFEVRVLGGLSLENAATGAVPSGALQRRRLSLLAVLALAGERGMSRERLQAYLWPESSAARARHALDQLLYTSRRDLGADSILSSATDVRLNATVIVADVWTFDAAIRDDRWTEAVEAYAGPLLDGIHFGDSEELERWIDAERARRHDDHLRALDALASSATRRGDIVAAVRWRRRQATADPVSSGVAVELMRALEAAGDRAGAIQHAHVHQQVLRSTLEVEPDAAVTALANAMTSRLAAGSVSTSTVGNADARNVPPSALAARLTTDADGAVAQARPRRTGRARMMAAVLGVAAVAAVLAARRQWVPAQSVAAPVGTTVAAARPTVEPPLLEARGESRDPEARSLYRRARSLWEKRTKEQLEQAVVLFRAATDRDPGYAAAYSGLAQSYALLGYFGFAPGDAMFPKARAAALRALELDPAAGEAYAALGQALAWQHAWTEAESAYQRALELSPGNATTHQWYALLLAYLGRAEEAAQHTGHASELDPLSVQVNNMFGIMLYYAGDLDGAMRQYERTVNTEPDSAWVRRNPWVLTNYSRVAAVAGRHALAIALVERALEVVPSHPRPLLDLAYAYVVAGRPDSARAVFARADTAHEHYAMYRALVHGLLGERGAAFAWFDRVEEWPLPSLVTLSCEPRLQPLRDDPRFARVRNRLNLPTADAARSSRTLSRPGSGPRS